VEGVPDLGLVFRSIEEGRDRPALVLDDRARRSDRMLLTSFALGTIVT